MDKKTIILLGASNSRVPFGLGAGLNQPSVDFHNLSLGGTDSVHKIYELKRNETLIKKADLIILEVNLMDTTMAFAMERLDYKIAKYMHYLYEELYLLKKKILVLLLFEPRCLSDNAKKSGTFLCIATQKVSSLL